MYIDPTILVFDQTRMRNEYNYIIRHNSAFLFTHELKLDSRVEVAQYNLANFQ